MNTIGYIVLFILVVPFLLSFLVEVSLCCHSDLMVDHGVVILILMCVAAGCRLGVQLVVIHIDRIDRPFCSQSVVRINRKLS